MAEEQSSSTTKDVIDAVSGLLKEVPVYQDSLQPAAKEIGKALQTAVKSLHVLLAPIEALVWGYEKIKSKLSEELEPKIQGIPEERRISPKPNIAVPAIEALRYLGHDDSLRELYVNLLASSMDKETAYRAHPSFVEIIKQLTSDEAKILHVLANEKSIPLISVKLFIRFRGIKLITKVFSSESYSYVNGIENFSNIGELAGCDCPNLTQNYLDNLHRLGLIQIQHGIQFTDSENYHDLENHKIVKKYIKDNKSPNRKPKIKRHQADVTNLGRQFISACVIKEEA